MTLPLPLNLEKWIEDHREDFVPPAGGKTVWEDTDFIVTVIGGPNDRPDYHDDPLEEFFYQLKGDITLRVIDDGKRPGCANSRRRNFFCSHRACCIRHSARRTLWA